MVNTAAVSVIAVLQVEEPDAYRKLCQGLKTQTPDPGTVTNVLNQLDIPERARLATKAALAVVIAEAKLAVEPTERLKMLISQVCP